MKSRPALLALAVLAGLGGDAVAASELRPAFRAQAVLIASDRSSPAPYPAFPALVDLGTEILVSIKSGRTHAADPGATLQQFRIDPASGRASAPKLLARLEDRIMQSGEWVRFGNGDVANYIDAQRAADPSRIGLRVVRSSDGGRTFGPLERLGEVDGVEYGYAFQAITEGHDTWMLVMTFTNLSGGEGFFAARPASGSVDVIRSSDDGRTWHFVRNLSRDFGRVPLTESGMLRYGDGFLVTSCGYDNHQRLYRTDAAFRLLHQIDLTATYPFVGANIGRPRLFARDGGVYLLGRNWTRATPPAAAQPAPGDPAPVTTMQLGLFRIEPEALAISAYCILDNAEGANVTDGYYAVPYFREVAGRTRINIVTYKGLNRQPPDIVRFEYLWDEVR